MQDIGKVSSAVSDMRKILRQDPRIIQKLHRRVFLDGIDRDQVNACLTGHHLPAVRLTECSTVHSLCLGAIKLTKAQLCKAQL